MPARAKGIRKDIEKKIAMATSNTSGEEEDQADGFASGEEEEWDDDKIDQDEPPPKKKVSRCRARAASAE
jgi:hypothetical protein